MGRKLKFGDENFQKIFSNFPNRNINIFSGTGITVQYSGLSQRTVPYRVTWVCTVTYIIINPPLLVVNTHPRERGGAKVHFILYGLRVMSLSAIHVSRYGTSTESYAVYISVYDSIGTSRGTSVEY